jgi:hypothetical protein
MNPDKKKLPRFAEEFLIYGWVSKYGNKIPDTIL